jgi:5-methylcytosine-specific restriction protein A
MRLRADVGAGDEVSKPPFRAKMECNRARGRASVGTSSLSEFWPPMPGIRCSLGRVLMPTSPPRPCAGGCGRLVSKGRCPDCSRQHDRTRRPEWITRFYGSIAWQKLRALKRSLDPICQDCRQAGRITAEGLDVDHAIPLEERPDLGLVLENLRTRCRDHHAAKTRGGGR